MRSHHDGGRAILDPMDAAAIYSFVSFLSFKGNAGQGGALFRFLRLFRSPEAQKPKCPM